MYKCFSLNKCNKENIEPPLWSGNPHSTVEVQYSHYFFEVYEIINKIGLRFFFPIAQGGWVIKYPWGVPKNGVAKPHYIL